MNKKSFEQALDHLIGNEYQLAFYNDLLDLKKGIIKGKRVS